MKSGELRPIINLRLLNKFVLYQHFKMDGINLVKDLLNLDDFLGSIALKNFYLMVPIHMEHRNYLRFRWQDSL